MTNQVADLVILQADAFRAGCPPLRNWNEPLRLYYDESNNIRRLKFTETGLNAPIDKPFVIAGLALRENFPADAWLKLRADMRIQTSALEIKYELVANRDYEKALASPKLAQLLTWLLEHQVMLHYSVLDVLHWSVLDIVESLMADERFDICHCHQELKSELLYVVRLDPDAFLAMLRHFNFPNVARGDTETFLTEVAHFIDQHAPDDRNAMTFLLRRTLHQAACLPGLELLFLHDNEPGALIDDFSIFFLRCVFIFKNACHTFDRETFVERVLKRVEIRDGTNRLDYRFAESTDELGIQASDVIAGLIGRHFAYLQANDLPKLRARKATFSAKQLHCLQLLRELIDRSDAFSEGLLHVIAPLDTVLKNNVFLHEKEAPAFLG